MILITHNWSKLSGLFDVALEMPQEERLPWLETLSDEYTDLKPRLRELLIAAASTDDVLHKPPNFAAAVMARVDCLEQLDLQLQPGKVIGSYCLLRELGEGGMGAVWLAERVDGKMRREVALKFPYAGPRQRQLAERLIRERDILANLQHPNIARLYDADVTASGQPYLVMEYIQGIPINAYCDQQRLTIKQRLILFLQVLTAMQYAHSRLIVHRDLKPSNILITSDGVAHLLDFGIATLTIDGQVQETPLTRFGGQVLTLEYASPEQLGHATVTTASDVYTLGVLLYELLTGALPYRAQRDNRVQLEASIATADIILPSHASIDAATAELRSSQPQAISKELRGDLDTLLLKSLKQGIEDRYSSADAIYQDIERYLTHQPILAQADTQWYRIKKFARRNRVAVASFAAIAVALMSGTGVALWQAHLAAQQAYIADQQRDRAVAAAARSEAVSDFLQLMTTDVADANEPVTLQKLIARSEDIANRSYAGNANQQAAILEVLGNYYLSFDHADKANEALGKALAIEEKNVDQAMQAKLHCSMALAQFMLGNSQTAEQNISVGMLLAHNDPYVEALCLYDHASLQSENGNLDGQLDDLHRAQDQLLKSRVNKPSFTLSIMNQLASVYADSGRPDEAESLYIEADKLLYQLGREETFSAVSLQVNWGQECADRGDQLGALQHEHIGLEILHKRGTGRDQDSDISIGRAVTLHLLGRENEAILILRRVILRAQKDQALTLLVYAKQVMVQSLLALGDISEAQKLVDQIVPMIGKEVPSDGVYAKNMFGIQGMLALKQHRYQEAVLNYSKLINALADVHVSGTYLSISLTMRGEAYLEIKDFSSALVDGTAAWDKSHAARGKFPYSNASGKAALLISKIHYARNEKEEAHKWAMIAYQQLQGSVGADHPDTLEAKHLLHSLQATHY